MDELWTVTGSTREFDDIGDRTVFYNKVQYSKAFDNYDAAWEHYDWLLNNGGYERCDLESNAK